MTRLTPYLVLLLSLAFLSPALAQDPVDEELGGGIESLSPKERVKRGGQSIDQMKSVRESGVSLLKKTRDEEKDIIKLNCINEKLSAIKGFLKVAEQAYTELQNQIDEKDEQGQIHQSKLIQLAERRVLPLGDEMQACAGDIIQYTGPTNLDVTIDDNVRVDNPTSAEPQSNFSFYLDMLLGDLERLPDVTPYQ